MTPEQLGRVLRAGRDFAEHQSRTDLMLQAMIKECDRIAAETSVKSTGSASSPDPNMLCRHGGEVHDVTCYPDGFFDNDPYPEQHGPRAAFKPGSTDGGVVVDATIHDDPTASAYYDDRRDSWYVNVNFYGDEARARAWERAYGSASSDPIRNSPLWHGKAIEIFPLGNGPEWHAHIALGPGQKQVAMAWMRAINNGESVRPSGWQDYLPDPPPEDPHAGQRVSDGGPYPPLIGSPLSDDAPHPPLTPDPYRGLTSGDAYQERHAEPRLGQALSMAMDDTPKFPPIAPETWDTGAHERRREQRMQDPEYREAYDRITANFPAEGQPDNDTPPTAAYQRRVNRISRAIAAGGDVIVTSGKHVAKDDPVPEPADCDCGSADCKQWPLEAPADDPGAVTVEMPMSEENRDIALGRITEPTVMEAQPKPGDIYHRFDQDPDNEHFCKQCGHSRYSDIHVLKKG